MKSCNERSLIYFKNHHLYQHPSLLATLQSTTEHGMSNSDNLSKIWTPSTIHVLLAYIFTKSHKPYNPEDFGEHKQNLMYAPHNPKYYRNLNTSSTPNWIHQ